MLPATTPVEMSAVAEADFADPLGRSADASQAVRQIASECWVRLAGLP